MDMNIAKQLLGRQFDKENEHGEYEFAMHLGELLTEPTGEDDITAEAYDFPIFFDREGDAWAIIHEYEEWLDLHTDEDQDHDIYSLEYIGDDSEYD